MDIWSPHVWKFLHASSTYFDQFHENQKEVYKNIILSIDDIIPCSICSGSVAEYNSIHPFTNSMKCGFDAFKWTVDFHNFVNKKISKDEVLFEEVFTEWCNTTNTTSNNKIEVIPVVSIFHICVNVIQLTLVAFIEKTDQPYDTSLYCALCVYTNIILCFLPHIHDEFVKLIDICKTYNEVLDLIIKLFRSSSCNGTSSNVMLTGHNQCFDYIENPKLDLASFPSDSKYEVHVTSWQSFEGTSDSIHSFDFDFLHKCIHFSYASLDFYNDMVCDICDVLEKGKRICFQFYINILTREEGINFENAEEIPFGGYMLEPTKKYELKSSSCMSLSESLNVIQKIDCFVNIALHTKTMAEVPNIIKSLPMLPISMDEKPAYFYINKIWYHSIISSAELMQMFTE